MLEICKNASLKTLKMTQAYKEFQVKEDETINIHYLRHQFHLDKHSTFIFMFICRDHAVTLM